MMDKVPGCLWIKKQDFGRNACSPNIPKSKTLTTSRLIQKEEIHKRGRKVLGTYLRNNVSSHATVALETRQKSEARRELNKAKDEQRERERDRQIFERVHVNSTRDPST
jgi:hypothetical protein